MGLLALAASFLVIGALGVSPPLRQVAPRSFEGYEIRPFQLEVEVFPGQHETFNGTVEQILAQVRKRNANWDEQIGAAVAGNSLDWSEPGLAGRDVNYEPQTETDVSQGRYWCGPTHDYCIKYRLYSGLEYLGRIARVPAHAEPGPKYCTRVSCSWQASIWFCNDSDKDLWIDSFQMIIDGVRWIIYWCEMRVADSNQWYVAGGLYLGNWHIVVRRDPDRC
ncbi:hypothetical protein VTI74DRAFT_11683 [Chaetomium olivicolor]